MRNFRPPIRIYRTPIPIYTTHIRNITNEKVKIRNQEGDSEVVLMRKALVVANAEIEALRLRWLTIRVSSHFTRVVYTEKKPNNTEP